MNITYSWLKEFVAFDWPVKELADKLTFSGVEVEAVTDIGGGDFRLELEVTPNRPDCLSLLGLAREISALSGLKINKPDCAVTETGPDVNSLATVRVDDTAGCPRYVARVITGVTVAESPDWLKTKLTGIGLRPVNNVADITNLVLYELGHPLHAFDLGKVAEHAVVVRRAKPGESLTTLDGAERKLDADHLVIADAKRPIGLAGIMGGLDSEISSATTNVLLESAHFASSLIRRESHTLGLKTDASYRFERGADPNALERAVDRCAKMIAEVCGGAVAKGTIDVSARQYSDATLSLRPEKANRLLGIEIPTARMAEILDALELRASVSGGKIEVTIPTFRRDLEREADLIEEIARFFGYDKIPTVVPPLRVLDPVPSHEPKMRRLAERLFHYGFDEVVNPSFADPEKDGRLGSGKTPVALRNPLSAKAAILRTTLLGGLLENAAWNLNRGLEGVHIFETGSVYRWAGETATAEDPTLGLLSVGPLAPAHWKDAPEAADLAHIKGAVESVLESLRYDSAAFLARPHPVLEAQTALAVLVKGEAIGWLGRLAAGPLDLYGLKGPAFAAEIDLGRLFKIKPRTFEFVPLPKYPAVGRDLSFWVRRATAFADIRQALAKLDVPWLEGFDVVDRYAGDKAPEGMIGLTLRFSYRSPKATLTAEDVDKSEQKILKALKTAFDIRLREGGV